jgi:putative ABC transport system permease protein
MRTLRQFLALLRVGLSGFAARKGPALTFVIGVGCAVGVLVSMLAMGVGARRQELGDVRADRAIVSSQGAEGGFGSVPRNEADTVQDMPDIRKDSQGRPIAVPESTLPMFGRRRGTGARVFFPLMGVTSEITELAPELRFTAGRMFKPGLHELVVSNACARMFSGFALGDRRSIQGIDWSIVGHFVLGSQRQCVVFADLDAMMSAFSLPTYSRIAVMLRSAADFPAFRAAIVRDPALHLEAQRERTVVEHEAKPLNALLDFTSYFVGTIMAIGGTLGAVNSLYAIVDSRRRELATLRAIGFRSGPIVISTLCESMLLAVPGALLGAGAAWALFDGLSASPFGFTFQLEVTPALMLLGTIWALAMGLIGGVLPAVRAARVPVTTALRAT